MPISKYFGGHGTEVMREMQAKNGEKEGKREFYATANKNKKKFSEVSSNRRAKES